MTNSIPKWTIDDQNQAIDNEGWLIHNQPRDKEFPHCNYFEHEGFQIQRADARGMMTDEEARTHVKELANQESTLHKKAQEFIIVSKFIPYKEMYERWLIPDD